MFWSRRHEVQGLGADSLEHGKNLLLACPCFLGAMHGLALPPRCETSSLLAWLLPHETRCSCLLSSASAEHSCFLPVVLHSDIPRGHCAPCDLGSTCGCSVSTEGHIVRFQWGFDATLAPLAGWASQSQGEASAVWAISRCGPGQEELHAFS